MWTVLLLRHRGPCETSRSIGIDCLNGGLANPIMEDGIPDT